MNPYTVNVFADVLDFMLIGHPGKARNIPAFPSAEIDKLCENLVAEEYTELREALLQRDLVAVADALADCIYVLIFTGLCHGIPMRAVWDAVQRANMAKFPDGRVLRRESDGKIMKPEGWEPPDIRGVLLAQGATEAVLRKLDPRMIQLLRRGSTEKVSLLDEAADLFAGVATHEALPLQYKARVARWLQRYEKTQGAA